MARHKRKSIKRVRGTYLSTKTGVWERHDSSFELRRFRTLDSDPAVKTWTKRHRIKIPYRAGSRRRRYIPDILVELHNGHKVLEEVKGFIFDKRNFVRKNLAARIWCAWRGIEFRIVFVDDLEKKFLLNESGDVK